VAVPTAASWVTRARIGVFELLIRNEDVKDAVIRLGGRETSRLTIMLEDQMAPV